MNRLSFIKTLEYLTYIPFIIAICWILSASAMGFYNTAKYLKNNSDCHITGSTGETTARMLRYESVEFSCVKG